MKKYGILQDMAEARKIIVVFLILLFVIIGMGVMFSRLSKNKNDKPILGGILDNIFFSKSLRPTPTPTPAGQKLITIRTDSTAPKGGNDGVGADADTIVDANYPAPETIPATGAPTIFLLFSGAGLGSGVLLKKFSR